MQTIFAIGTLTVASGLLTAPTVAAQTWFAPAYPAHPTLGAADSFGALIWSHSRSLDAEDSRAPPYIGALRNAGWDTFRFNRSRATDTLTGSAPVLAKKSRELKPEGYHQVVLAGQSFGGFLMAADTSDG